MIESPFLRGVLVVVLLAFAAFCFDMVWTEGGPGSALMIGLALGAITFAAGLVFRGRRRLALRAVAGGVVLAYLAYFGVELWGLLNGEHQPFRVGAPSALSAGLGLLVWAVPLLVYALSNRSLREHRELRAAAGDSSGERADRLTLDALVRAGADINLPTEVRFYIDLPSLAHARSVENVTSRQGYRVELDEPDNADEWCGCCVIQELVPSWENIRAERARLTKLAADFGGSVDGWEAMVRANGDSD